MTSSSGLGPVPDPAPPARHAPQMPSAAAAGGEMFEALKDDPELSGVFDDVKANGVAALQKYWDDAGEAAAQCASRMTGGPAQSAGAPWALRSHRRRARAHGAPSRCRGACAFAASAHTWHPLPRADPALGPACPARPFPSPKTS
jgi:hypothetical protein